MAKALKALIFTVLFLIIHFFIMLMTQIVLGMTIGGAGRGLTALVGSGAAMDPVLLSEAANSATTRILDFVQKNAGIVYSISSLTSLLIFIKIYQARKKPLFEVIRMDRRPSGADVRFGAFAGASSNIFISLVIVALQNMRLFTDAFSQYETSMSYTFGSGNVLQLMLGIGIIAPLVEEILFRGMITAEFAGAFPLIASIIFQGVIFGLIHGVPVQICFTIPLGIYFGFMLYKTGSIWPGAAAHIAMNSTSILLTIPSVNAFFSGSRVVFLAIVLIGIIMFVGSLVYFIKKEPALTAPV